MPAAPNCLPHLWVQKRGSRDKAIETRLFPAHSLSYRRVRRPAWTRMLNDPILVNWWNMEKFGASHFFELAASMQALIEYEATEDEQLGDDYTKACTWLSEVRDDCHSIGLNLCAKRAEALCSRIESGSVRAVKDVKREIEELQHLIQDEMGERMFVYVPPERAAFYNQPELFGREVNAKFPTIQFDLVEAGNCYAAGRSTAVVFHLMRIMEIGVQAFGTKLGVPLTNERVWQVILDGVNKAIAALHPKNPITKELAEVSANLYSVKLAWRNEVMHPKDTYTLEESENLIRQVKIFMGQLTKVI